MPIAKITGQGLAAIALSVALLWACLIGERVMVRRAYTQRAQVMRDLQRMQRSNRSEPVSAPVHLPRRVRATAGHARCRRAAPFGAATVSGSGCLTEAASERKAQR